MQSWTTWTLATILTTMVACGSSTETPAPEPEAAPAAEAPKAKQKAKGKNKAKGKAKKGQAKVFFTEPKDGAEVTSPVKLAFGVEGMEVKPAGEVVEGTGHHHVIIGPAGVPEGEVVPADKKHIHFGKGQTEAELELPPGEHKLTMQFADGSHTSYGEVMAATITITVTE